ncbi:hypothetical protein POM88_020395 [Heracleum sosnowskyi]|uniref:Uncharacterized protein n=1 Tax=Heracleum sosnowskyi TaxID=360622 RepID=A0AAD8IEZ0_9APIA|nr:hypothetical protein POM88_020395 [Heracleum sosnowskyi]
MSYEDGPSRYQVHKNMSQADIVNKKTKGTAAIEEFYPPKLIILALPHSKIKTMWELNMAPHLFFQIYSGFGHEIKIYAPLAEIPDWISQTSTLKENKETYGTTYSVRTITSEFIWSNTLNISCRCESLMVVVPRSIFLAGGSDNRIELTANAEFFVHLLYNTKDTVTEECDRTTINVEGEISYPSKRLKH